jgi:regulator of RNase E activity RraB
VPDDEGERWNIEAGIKDTVQDLTSPSNVRKFVELAAQFNALFDGWGTVV